MVSCDTSGLAAFFFFLVSYEAESLPINQFRPELTELIAPQGAVSDSCLKKKKKNAHPWESCLFTLSGESELSSNTLSLCTSYRKVVMWKHFYCTTKLRTFQTINDSGSVLSSLLSCLSSSVMHFPLCFGASPCSPALGYSSPPRSSVHRSVAPVSMLTVSTWQLRRSSRL